MKEKLYQMKDIMEKYNVSRDSIKYYEKKGLITPVRSDAGYRLYDESALQKIKVIMDLRDLGFPVELTETQTRFGRKEDAQSERERIRDEIEQEIIRLNERLERISVYEQWCMRDGLYLKCFKMDTDFRVCLSEKCISPQLQRRFYVRDMLVFQVNEQHQITEGKETVGVLLREAEIIEKNCRKCKEKKCISYDRIYRGSWMSGQGNKPEDVIQQMYQRADDLGYELQKKVYCIKKSIQVEGEDRIRFDICIPFVE